jgi:hypothetical protein
MSDLEYGGGAWRNGTYEEDAASLAQLRHLNPKYTAHRLKQRPYDENCNAACHKLSGPSDGINSDECEFTSIKHQQLTGHIGIPDGNGSATYQSALVT